MKTNKRKLFWFSVVAMLALVLSACGASSKEPTPTPVDVNAVAANAIATFAMGLTQTAFAQPTPTFTPQPSATNALPSSTFSPFGTNTPAAQPTSSCDVSVYVNDVTVPDGTVMAPGQVFTKTWLLKNTGTCPWTATYKVGFGFGSPMSGVPTAIGKNVAPGEQVQVSVVLTAPNTAGEVSGVWRLMNDKGQFFGTNVTVVIKVVGATVPTSTPTENPTATP